MRSEPIRPHYVNIASGSFYWCVFLFCVWVQLFYFFSLSFKKNKCAASVLVTKTMTIKTDCNTEHRPCILAVLAVLWRWLVRLCSAADVYILSPGFVLKFVD